MTTRIQQVAALLRAQAPRPLCDDCIAAEIGITRQTSNTITNSFDEARGEFRKDQARCSGCGSDKLATSAFRTV